MINVNQIITENSRRKKEINKPYEPVTGEGCQGERVCLKIKDAPCFVLYLPLLMMKEKICRQLKKYKSVERLFEVNKMEYTKDSVELFWITFSEIRIKYDFEYFAYCYQTILDGESAEEIPFKLKRPQRNFTDTLEKMRVDNVPIRAIILKARQMGLSTLTQLYMYWIQNVHKRNWDSVICAHVQDAAKKIRSMYKKAIDKMPPIEGEKRTMIPFEGTQNIKLIPQRGCTITIGSAETPDSVRSQNPKLAHFSEVAMYPNTTKKGTGDLIGSIVGAIKRIPYTMIVYESTAKGVGDYFHGEWIKAKEGKTSFAPVFLPWYYDDTYYEDITSNFYNHSGQKITGTVEDFVLSLNEYELNLFQNHHECTLENINWYRGKNSEMTSDELMKQEYPSDDIEAFQDSGLPAFRSYHIESLRKDCKHPVSVGELNGDASPTVAKMESGRRKDILSNIRFVEDIEAVVALKNTDPVRRDKKIRNKLKVWEFPEKEIKVSDRYVVVFDPQRGLSEKADYGVIAVFDRFPMIYGGVPEIVAEWRGRIDKDFTIWIAAQIAKYYCDALLVVESNTYDTDKKKDDYSEFIFDTIANYYNNLYAQESSPDEIKKGIPKRYGFFMSRPAKLMIISNYAIMLREKAYKERSEEALNEARVYEQKEDGTYGAKDGHHDDILITRMIGCDICYKLPIPVIVDDTRKRERELPIGESSL